MNTNGIKTRADSFVFSWFTPRFRQPSARRSAAQRAERRNDPANPDREDSPRGFQVGQQEAAVPPGPIIVATTSSAAQQG
jgi:hypothetical protein